MIIVETAIFTNRIRDLMPDDEYRKLQAAVVVKPDIGAIIKGSGGLRKMRWKSPGKGKSGGIRVIYYWVVDKFHIRMLYAYEKSNQADLTTSQLKQLKEIIERW